MKTILPTCHCPFCGCSLAPENDKRTGRFLHVCLDEFGNVRASLVTLEKDQARFQRLPMLITLGAFHKRCPVAVRPAKKGDPVT